MEHFGVICILFCKIFLLLKEPAAYTSQKTARAIHIDLPSVVNHDSSCFRVTTKDAEILTGWFTAT